MFISGTKKHPLLHGFILLIGLVYSGLVCSNTDVSKLQSLLNDNKQMYGSFTQVIVSENGTKTESAMGDFWIKSPGKFRWDYTTPYVQNIVSDGLKVWFYDEDLEQVTIKTLSQSVGNSPLAIFDGSIPVQDVFTVENLEPEDNIFWVKLTPKGEITSFESIDMGFSGGVLARMNMHDQFGQTTRLLFSDVVKNTSIDNSIFTFEAPESVDVFEEQ